MADPLSVAFGVAQVAQTGFQLVETIYNYTKSVRKAEQQLQSIAEYVQVTSTAFEHIASHLQDDDLRTLYKPALLTSTKDALQGCEAAFGRLKTYIQTLVSGEEDKSRGGITTKTKLTWRWKQKELESHQVHLERCKGTVSVLLGTLTLISVSKKSNDAKMNEKDILSTKLELQRLLKVEAEAKQREAQFDAFEDSTVTEVNSVRELDIEGSRDIRGMPTPTFQSQGEPTALQYTWTASTLASVDDYASLNRTQPQRAESYHSLSSQLYACEAAMDKLSATLRDAIRKWERFQTYETDCLLPEFQTLHGAIEALTTYEKDSGINRRVGEVERSSTGAYYGGNDWDYRGPGLGPSQRQNIRGVRYSHQNNEGDFYRTRSQGHGPVPVVNVYNDVYQDNYHRAESPYPPYPPSPIYGGRNRLQAGLANADSPDTIEDLSLESRRRSRSRGRSDAGFDTRREAYYDWEQRRSSEEERLKDRPQVGQVKSEKDPPRFPWVARFGTSWNPSVSPGPTPPAHRPAQSDTTGRHPDSGPLPGVPERKAESQFFYKRNYDDSRPISREEAENLSQDELFEQVEHAVMGGNPGSLHSPSISVSQAPLDSNKTSSTPALMPTSPKLKRKSSLQRDGNVQNRHLNSSTAECVYSSDSDTEAAQGLAIMQMAEEDDARRRQSGSIQKRFTSGYGSQRSSQQASQQQYLASRREASDSDDHEGVDPYCEPPASRHDVANVLDAPDLTDVNELLRKWTWIGV